MNRLQQKRSRKELIRKHRRSFLKRFGWLTETKLLKTMKHEKLTSTERLVLRRLLRRLKTDRA